MPEVAEKTVQQKTKRKWPLFAALILAAAAAAGIFVLRGAQEQSLTVSPTDTAKLVRCDLQDTISTTGSVESAQSMTVYSTKAYPVQEVLVEVGDRVTEGQLLCKLDAQTILNQMESQQASLDASTASSDAAIRSAQDNYRQFKESLEKGTNASIISAETAVTNARNAYQTAQDNYDRYVAGLNAGENTTLLAQENALRTAKTAVDNAYEAYYDALEALEDTEDALDDAYDALDDAEDEQKSAKRASSSAYNKLEEAQESLEDVQSRIVAKQKELESCTDEVQKLALRTELVELQGKEAQLTTDISALEIEATRKEVAFAAADSALTQADALVEQYEKAVDTAEDAIQTCLTAITNAEAAYENTQKQYNAAVTGVDNLLTDYQKNVETAKQALETAQASLTAAKTAADNQLKTYQNSLNTAYANAGKGTLEVSLRQLETELSGTEITAPMAGTVTAVYAKVGSAGSGLLFVIEDTENFVITTSVKDYDITSVDIGTKAAIRSDATGDDVYDGEVTYLAPTANKTPTGVTDTSGDITFAADVKVNDTDTRLRIGLNVRLSLIVEEEKDVLAAPYDAVYTNQQGQTCLLLASQQEDGLYLLTEQPVEVGMESDLELAVKADSLTDGMTVICSPEQYLTHVGQKIAIGTAARQGLLGGN